jgi:hypothetical protein
MPPAGSRRTVVDLDDNDGRLAMSDQSLTIRTAVPDDGATLRRLAQLDSAPVLHRRVLLAESDGVPVAAISLDTGAVTADPFQPNATAVRLLRLRRYQLLRQGGDAGPAKQLLRRLVPDPGR